MNFINKFINSMVEQLNNPLYKQKTPVERAIEFAEICTDKENKYSQDAFNKFRDGLNNNNDNKYDSEDLFIQADKISPGLRSINVIDDGVHSVYEKMTFEEISKKHLEIDEREFKRRKIIT